MSQHIEKSLIMASQKTGAKQQFPPVPHLKGINAFAVGSYQRPRLATLQKCGKDEG